MTSPLDRTHISSSTLLSRDTFADVASQTITVAADETVRLDMDLALQAAAAGQGQSVPELIGMSAASPGGSALDILNRNPEATSGVYWIDPDGGDPSNSFQVFCDMDFDGGGWMLAINSVMGSEAATNAIDTNTGIVDLNEGHTRDVSELAIDQNATIRHEIDANNQGYGEFHAQYLGRYTDAMPDYGAWTVFGPSNSSLLVSQFTRPFTNNASYGAPWYYSASGSFSSIPSTPSDGFGGPSIFNNPSIRINSYRIWVREADSTPTTDMPQTGGEGGEVRARFVVDGTPGEEFGLSIEDNGFEAGDMERVLNLSPGEHTVSLQLQQSSEAEIYLDQGSAFHVQTFASARLLPTIVSLVSLDDSADENAAETGSYRLTRDHASGQLEVELAISGTVSADDFILSGGSVSVSEDKATVTFDDGITVVDLVLTPLNDLSAETDETLPLVCWQPPAIRSTPAIRRRSRIVRRHHRHQYEQQRRGFTATGG